MWKVKHCEYLLDALYLIADETDLTKAKSKSRKCVVKLLLAQIDNSKCSVIKKQLIQELNSATNSQRVTWPNHQITAAAVYYPSQGRDLHKLYSRMICPTTAQTVGFMKHKALKLMRHETLDH